MTDEELPQDPNEIPELLDRLTPRLSSPEPADIRGEATRRGDVRRRTLMGAGVFVLVATLLGGLWTSNRNAVNETATAAEPGRPVGGDSAPLEFDEWPGPPLEGTGLIEGESVREQMIATSWRVGAVRGDSQGFVALTGYVMFNADPTTYGLPAHVDTILYTTGCEGSAYVIDWAENIDFSANPAERIAAPSFRVVRELSGIPIAANVRCIESTKLSTLIEGTDITFGWADTSNSLTMGAVCPPTALCTPKGFWTIALVDSSRTPAAPVPPVATRPIPAVVSISECANGSHISLNSETWLPIDTNGVFLGTLPAEWEGAGTVDVTVIIDENTLVATDGAGLTAPFRRTGDDQIVPFPCLSFTNNPPTPVTPDAADVAFLVPDVSGLSFNEALNILFEFDIRTSRVDEPSDVVAKGLVITTTPAPGAVRHERGIVTLIISSGPEVVADVPAIDARSDSDCIAGFLESAAASDAIDAPGADERAWATFQAGDEWEGRTDVCWISITTETGCRSYAWFRELGDPPATFAEDPPLDPNEPCVGHGVEFS